MEVFSQNSNLIKILKTTLKPVTEGEKTKKRCCPYDFDGSICQTIGGRLLCGYNKNKGRSDSENDVKDLTNGCRLRGGRLECGYLNPPFINTRRPPAGNSHEIIAKDDKGCIEINGNIFCC